jgi:hypothetical protein
MVSLKLFVEWVRPTIDVGGDLRGDLHGIRPN